MKKGFTLAEVLITLAIIGVVAALTIPSVILNAEQQQFKTGLKKAVSVLNEAIQMNIQEDGETPYDGTNMYVYLQKHMSILKSNWSGRNVNDLGQVSYYHYNEQGNLMFYSTDGMRFEFQKGYANSNLKLHESNVYIKEDGVWNGFERCGSYGLSQNPNNTKNPPCIILVDVNGDKKPNPQTRVAERTYFNPTWGNYTTERTENRDYLFPTPSDKKLTDIFNILITDEKAIPFGVVAQRAMYSSK